MRKKLKILIVITVVTIAAVVWLMWWMNTPSEGTVRQNQSKPSAANPTPQDKQLNGENISFQYGGKYVPSSNQPSNNDLERYTLSAATNYDKRILASVANLPDGRLDANGDYIYRQRSPTVYTKRQLKTPVATFDVWIKNDGTEQTAMAARGDKAIVISFMTSLGIDESLTPEVDKLLQSIQWKQ